MTIPFRSWLSNGRIAEIALSHASFPCEDLQIDLSDKVDAVNIDGAQSAFDAE